MGSSFLTAEGIKTWHLSKFFEALEYQPNHEEFHRYADVYDAV